MAYETLPSAADPAAFAGPVVDSPLPSAASPLAAPPVVSPSAPSPGGMQYSTDPAAGAPTPVAPVVPAVDPIAGLATQYGIPAEELTGFTDEANARIHIQRTLDRYAREGLQFQNQRFEQDVSQVSNAPVVPPIVPPTTFEFDEATDPKVVAAFNKVQADIAAAAARAEKAEQSLTHFHESQARQAQQQIVSRASSSVDKLASPKYGVAGNRTAAQQMELQGLFGLADSLIAGYTANGRQVPVIETIVAQALLLHNQTAAPAQAAAPPAQAIPGTLAQRPVAPVVPISKPGGSLTEDAQFMSAAREIMRRGM